MTNPGLCIYPSHGVDGNGEPVHREAEHGRLCNQHFGRMNGTVREVADLWMDLAFISEAGSAPKDETPKTGYIKASEAPAPANLEVLALRDAASTTTAAFKDVVDVPLNRYAVMQDGSLSRVARRGNEPKPGEVDDRDPRIRRIRAAAADTSPPIPSLVAIVASWVLLVAEERPLTATLPSSAMAQLGLLRTHATWIAAQDWCDDYINEMTDLRKALSAALRDHTHKQVGRCRLPVEGRDGVCGGPLIEENGSDVIRCGDCRAQWSTPQERARLAMSLESA